MARPLRIEYPGAVYHVMSRGNNRKRVFHSKKYYELFLEKLELFSEKFDIEVRCYCLMPNHFHLYLRTAQANLSRFMQSLLTSFTIISNRWRRSAGHVFQGRFKSCLVEDEKYGSVLSRYVHLNPVNVKALANADTEDRLRTLYEYKWSSFPSLVGFCDAPNWLDTDSTLCRWGSSNPDQQISYRHYVEEGLSISHASPLEEAVAGAILGDRIFIEKVTKRNLAKLQHSNDQPAATRLRGGLKPDAILAAVATVRKIEIQKLTCRINPDRDGRQLAIYCVERYCRATSSQAQLASLFELKLPGFVAARARADRKIGDSAQFSDQLNHIIAHLSDLQHQPQTTITKV